MAKLKGGRIDRMLTKQLFLKSPLLVSKPVPSCFKVTSDMQRKHNLHKHVKIRRYPIKHSKKEYFSCIFISGTRQCLF